MITATALRFADKVIAADGICEHRGLIGLAFAEWIDLPGFDPARVEHGFIDAAGTFLSRAESLPVAVAAGQLPADYRPNAAGLQSQHLIERRAA